MNTLPWHAEGERQHAACYLALCGHPEGPTLVDGNGALEPSEAQSVGVTAASAALHGSLYLWRREIEDVADAAPLPKHIVSANAMQHSVMFWSRDSARIFDDGGENNWLLLIRKPGGIDVFGDATYNREKRVEIRFSQVQFGKVYPDGYLTDEVDSVRIILARLAFLNSPYVGAAAEKLPRAWRRSASRLGASALGHDPSIRVVQLRRDARENLRRDGESGAHSVEWKHQWWVSGHYRAQWYPSEEAHKVIWIASHLKGPADLPVAQKVYAVVR